MVQMELSRIMIREGEDGQIIVLKEIGGERSFPIFIGTFEATIIDRYVSEIETPRPLTHDLLAGVIAEMGGRLERIVVCDLKHDIFFAQLRIETDHMGTVQVDARPSDAICLALRTGADIYVEDHVLNTAGGEPGV